MEKKAKRAVKRYSVVVQEWLESEAGWGCRPDGVSLHLNDTDRKQYCELYWKREKERNPSGVTPAEYSRECGSPYIIDVDATTYRRIKQSPSGGIRCWQTEFRQMKQALEQKFKV